MAKKPKMHKADEYVLKQIAAANVFCAVMFLGSGRYLCEEFSTLSDARKRAAEMTKQYSNECSGRQAWVSAIDGRGASHPVPDNYVPNCTEIGYVTAASRRARKVSSC